MPPYTIVRDVLGEEMVAGLLDHAQAHRSQFFKAKVGETTINPALRVSAVLRELGEFRAPLEQAFLDLLPGLTAALGMAPIAAPNLVIELVAHGDGAFYGRHTDVQLRGYRQRRYVRVLSAVHYLHAEPKRFSGGELRLHSIGGDSEGKGRFVDIPPDRNTLLAFPSWAPHEVRPVACPSGRFEDSRFAINCWFRTARETG